MPTELELTQECPPRNQLQEYLLGQLPDDRREPLESHFADCRHCEETLNLMSEKDTWIQLTENAGTGPVIDQHEREFISRLVSQLQGEERFQAPPRAVQERAAEIIRLLPPAKSPESLGQLGHYRMERVLGAGSSGVVFYAVDELLDRPVALKVLRPSLGSLAQQRFIIEARATASITHPQIVTIFQVGQTADLAYIAMPWLPGETLESRLSRVTFLPESEVREIGRQILLGLHAAHAKMLVHRDIKPANIWLCENNNEVKILDFGLARIADDDPQLTSTGMLAGTPNFMSPEQTRGLELDGRTDLFSLGCLMYQAATGKLPFGEKGILATLQSIQHHHPQPPRELNPSLSEDFSDLVMCLLEKQPANRPGAADKLAQALSEPRKEWGISVPRYTTATMTSNREGHGSKPPLKSPVIRRRTMVIRGSIAVAWIGLAFWGWSIFGQQIIRIVTNQGEIVIESNDPNIKVEILRNGELIRVVDLKTEQKIDILAGDYEIKAGSDASDQSITVLPNQLTMSRGGQQVVVISRQARVGDTPSLTSANRDEPTYDGRTFDTWLKQMQFERSQDSIRQGAVAIGTLSRDDDAKIQRACDWIRPLIREHGSNTIGAGSPWPETFNLFFSQLPPRQTVRFAIEEMVAGNSRSREQMIWNVILGNLYEGDSQQITEHRQAIRDQFPMMLNKGLKLIEDNPSTDASRNVRALLLGATRSSIQYFSASYPYSPESDRDYVSVLQPQLETRLAESHHPEVQAFLAATLIFVNAESRLGVQQFCERLSDPQVPDDLTGQMFYNHLASFRREDIPQVVPALTNLFDSDAMCDRLARANPIGQSSTSSGGGFGGGAGVGVGGFEFGAVPPTPTAARLMIRHQILDILSHYGIQASGALPWLEALASQPAESSEAEQLSRKANDVALTLRSLLETTADQETAADPAVGSERDSSGLTTINDAASQKTLLGKNLAEWLEILKTELDNSTLRQACLAIGELGAVGPESSNVAAQALVELLESPREFSAAPSPNQDEKTTTSQVITTAIESLSTLPIENADLGQRARHTVEEIVRAAPLTRGVGSTFQGQELIQDAMGRAACQFFANHLEPEQVISFLEVQLVAGTDQSSFRLRQLPLEPEFVRKLTLVLPTLADSLATWPTLAKREPPKMATREFLRLCIFKIDDLEFANAAEAVRTEFGVSK